MAIFNLKTNKKTREFLRKNMTKTECVLWKELRRKKIGFKFRRQFGVGPYIIDFYCPQLKFAIELDGDVHAFESTQKKDKIRQKFLESKNLYIKRYWNIEIAKSLNSVIKDIYNTCIRLSELKQKQSFDPHKSPPKIRGRLQWGLM